MAKQLSKWTDNEIKNYWNTYLKKRAKTADTKRELAESTKSSSSNDGQPNSTNPHQTNNVNNVTNHSSQDAGNMVPRCTDMDPTQDRLPNVMPRLAPANLLNIFATRLPSSYCPVIRKYRPMIQSPSALVDGKVAFSNGDDLSSSDSQSKPAISSSARSLLNKMAHCINELTTYLEVVNSIMSKSGNKGTDTSFGDDLFGQTWMQSGMSNSTEAAEKLASDLMAEDVRTLGVQEDQNGNGIESLIKDLDLDFLLDWTIMDDDDNDIGVIGGGLYEDGVANTWINSDNHII